jgi:hypothetical protein
MISAIRVVILGDGFAAEYTAIHLEQRRRRKLQWFERKVRVAVDWALDLAVAAMADSR